MTDVTDWANPGANVMDDLARERAARDTLEAAAAKATAHVLAQDEWDIGSHGERVQARTSWEEHHAAKRGAPPANYVEVLPESAVRIARECDRIKAFLIEKNLSYGNSALEPVRIFSDASPVEQLLVRIDDKLSRKKRGRPFQGDNDRVDLIGYLILLGLALAEDES